MSSARPVFELGLVMAGAVSAGAYTAGVLDFLLQALDRLEEVKASGDDLPHAVRIKAISGASAGGISAALLATLVTREHRPVTGVPPMPNPYNKLYSSWVERADLRRMLESRDCPTPDTPLKSLLDVTVLEEIAADAFLDGGDLKLRPYLDRDLHVLLSVTNLRGVPYSIRFSGTSDAIHDLSLHADYLHFVVGNSGDLPAVEYLDPLDLSAPGWVLLKQTALATSAYPLGLAPRLLHRRPGDYAQRRWWIPAESGITQKRCFESTRILPHWPQRFSHSGDPSYEFLCVDGGVMNNEPLELVRRILAGSGGSNPRKGSEADRAVLMIDPFPDPKSYDPDYVADDSLMNVFPQLFRSLVNQARFKPEELALAWHEDVFSRFLVAPSAPDGHDPALPALASSSLDAFGGFLDIRLRRHDFQLGRRNCQSFLGKYFVLPEENPLFAQWSEAQRDRYRLERNGKSFLPIIPLVDETVREPIPAPEWPHLPDTFLDELSPLLGHRADTVVQSLLSASGGWCWLLMLGWKW